MPNLGDVFPDFEADSTEGKIKFHEKIEAKWAILFSHPADFTPVCTTELGRLVQMADQFKALDCELFALSCDSAQSHKDWSKDVLHYAGNVTDKLPYIIIADEKRELAVQLGMVDPDEKDSAGLPLTCRAVFIIGPDKRLKLSILYPATTGRNFDEILRVLKSLQLTATKKVATPENWKAGERCMVLPTVPKEDVPKLFPKGVEIKDVPSGKKYLCFTPQP